MAEAAEAWARAVAGEHGRVVVSGVPLTAVDELLGHHEGPVLLVAPDVPRLDATLATAALADLEAGCALALAPATDARPYLLAIAPAVRADVLALLGDTDRHRDTLFGEVSKLGEVGLLRSERRLVTPADARALAADPLAPAPLRALAA